MNMKQTKRRRGDRYDAALVPAREDLTGMFPYLFKRRCDSIVLFREELDVENALSWMAEKKAAGKPVTFFQLVLLAMIRVMRERPALNRYIAGRRLYQRHAVTVNFVAKQSFEDDAPESNVFIKIDPEEKTPDILAKITGHIQAAKRGEATDDGDFVSTMLKLPRFLLMFIVNVLEWIDFYFDTPKLLRGMDPLRCSLFLTNLGSIGVEAPYHHLFEWGNCSFFAAIGKIKPSPWVDESGSLTVRKTVEIKYTMDERIADGFYFARSLELFEGYMKNPSLLESD
jgi:hypothetical protein